MSFIHTYIHTCISTLILTFGIVIARIVVTRNSLSLEPIDDGVQDNTTTNNNSSNSTTTTKKGTKSKPAVPSNDLPTGPMPDKANDFGAWLQYVQNLMHSTCTRQRHHKY
jgi:hypothetical protein